MTTEEMEQHLTAVVANRPELKRLMAAKVLTGERLRAEVDAILKEWRIANNRAVKLVDEGVVQQASGRPGNLVWLRGQNEIWIEKQVIRNPQTYLDEIRHELVADALGGGHGTAAAYIEMTNGTIWNAQVILEDAVARTGDVKRSIQNFIVNPANTVRSKRISGHIEA